MGIGFDVAFASFGDVRQELEELKLRLAAMEADELPENEARAIATEISAIRLHLKRLALDREVADRAYRAARANL